MNEYAVRLRKYVAGLDDADHDGFSVEVERDNRHASIPRRAGSARPNWDAQSPLDFSFRGTQSIW